MSESDEGGDSSDRETLENRLDECADALDDAETEADLDAVEDLLDDIEAAISDATLPEPDDDEESDPRDELGEQLEELRSSLEEKRGPYASDVIDSIEDVRSTIEETEWTEAGEADLVPVVEAFLTAVSAELDVEFDTSGMNFEDLGMVLETAATSIDDADLDADGDADTITVLLEATTALGAGGDSAQSWDDLTVREQLDAHGFYDVLGHYKDFPPEWSAIKAYEQEGNVDMILLAHDLMDSNFMEEHCLAALRRLGDERALEPMVALAERRDKAAIEVLGKIANDEPLDMLLDYVDTPSDPQLQKVTLKALGEIGSIEATQGVAEQLVVENASVRSHAARSLGMIGDTRAIQPLADVLENDDSDFVRASAAWALFEIGTQAAFDVLETYAEDRVYLVQAEATKALDAD